MVQEVMNRSMLVLLWNKPASLKSNQWVSISIQIDKLPTDFLLNKDLMCSLDVCKYLKDILINCDTRKALYTVIASDITD